MRDASNRSTDSTLGRRAEATLAGDLRNRENGKATRSLITVHYVGNLLDCPLLDVRFFSRPRHVGDDRDHYFWSGQRA